MKSHKSVIISGGGTGGHVFPAIAIANALKQKDKGIELLFVGAEGKLEMDKVPAAGYKIIGLPVSGFQRKLSFKNITFFFKLFSSVLKSRKIVKTFKPDVVVGVGGYASGPVLYMASKQKIPVVIQEQNSYAGVTNKILAKRSKKICVAYDRMERFFPADRIVMTGNPVRKDLAKLNVNHDEAIEYFGLDKNKETIFITGGSLGAGTINKSIFAGLDKICSTDDVQIIWQTGKYYYENLKAEVDKLKNENNKISKVLWINAFVSRMDFAYSAADIIIGRAGAITISELCLIGKPVILVPSPNVSEDHQTKNAMALVNNKAAIMIKDSEANDKLVDAALKLLRDEKQKQELSDNISKMAMPDAAERIADEILGLIK